MEQKLEKPVDYIMEVDSMKNASSDTKKVFVVTGFSTLLFICLGLSDPPSFWFLLPLFLFLTTISVNAFREFKKWGKEYQELSQSSKYLSAKEITKLSAILVDRLKDLEKTKFCLSSLPSDNPYRLVRETNLEKEEAELKDVSARIEKIKGVWEREFNLPPAIETLNGLAAKDKKDLEYLVVEAEIEIESLLDDARIKNVSIIETESALLCLS